MLWELGRNYARSAAMLIERRGNLFPQSPDLRIGSSSGIPCECASLPRAMCGVVGIYRTPGSGEPRLPRPVRAPAPRAGVGGHRLDRRRPAALRSREMGHVNDIFTADRLKDLPGFAAIGHVRYSTAGDSSQEERPADRGRLRGRLGRRRPQRQPGQRGRAARAARGGRARSSRAPPTPRCIVHLIARSRERTLPERVADALRQVRGAYSLVFLTEDMLIAVRDPMGFRPLVLGKVEGRLGGLVRDLRVRADRGRVRARRRAGRDGDHRRARACAACARSPPQPPHRCVFE